MFIRLATGVDVINKFVRYKLNELSTDEKRHQKHADQMCVGRMHLVASNRVHLDVLNNCTICGQHTFQSIGLGDMHFGKQKFQ